MGKSRKPKMTMEDFLLAYKGLFKKGWRAYWGAAQSEAKPIWLTPSPGVVYRTEDYRRIQIFCPLSALSAELGGPIVRCTLTGVVRKFLNMESSIARQIIDESGGVKDGPLRKKLIRFSIFDKIHQPYITSRHGS